MSRERRLYLDDMILCCEKIALFVGKLTRDGFLANVLVYGRSKPSKTRSSHEHRGQAASR
jgi:hypothetical protein